MKSPEYLAINPMGKVPALRHGDTVVTETGRSAPISRMHFPRPASRRRQAGRCVGRIIDGCSLALVRSRRHGPTRR